MLNFNDIKNDMPKVLDYLDNTIFSDSTITMMTDEYIKKSVLEKLTQVVLHKEYLVRLNDDPKALTRAMLRSSLNEKDVNFILNASLKVSGVRIKISSDKPEEEVDPEAANKMITAKMESMCSVESVISLIRDNLGTSRVVPAASSESQMTAMQAFLANPVPNATPIEPINDMLYIERPLELDLSLVDMSKLDNGRIFEFLNCLMSSDSNSELGISVPIDAFIPSVQDFFKTDLPAVCDAAVAFAKNSAKNSISFTAELDPYQSIFNTL